MRNALAVRKRGRSRATAPVLFFVVGALTCGTVSAQQQKSLEGDWEVTLLSVDGKGVLHRGALEGVVSGQTLDLWERDEGTRRRLFRFHFAVKEDDAPQINLIPRPLPPKKGRPLSADEQKYASTGFKGIYRLDEDQQVVEVYFPMDSRRARPRQIQSGGRQRHWYIRMKRRPHAPPDEPQSGKAK